MAVSALLWVYIFDLTWEAGVGKSILTFSKGPVNLKGENIMFKKIISLITLLSFLNLLVSCAVHTAKKEKVETAAYWEGVQFLGVLKTSGEKIEFTKKSPGRIQGNAIVGLGIVKKRIEIDRADVKSIKRISGRINQIITKDGEKYDAIAYTEGTTKIIIQKVSESVSIPLSEVELVWVKRVDFYRSFLMTMGFGMFMFYLIGGALWAAGW